MENSSLLNNLNAPQKEAVLDFSNNLLILAGAGSGKTRVITTKIAYAIKEMNYNPWQVLAVTFTNKATAEMRERVEKMLDGETTEDGSPKADSVMIRTFHALGAYILRRFGETIGLNPNFTIYDDTESLELMQREFPNSTKKDLKPYMNAISRAKDRNIDPYGNLMKVNPELDDLKEKYIAYEEALRKTGCVDFGDLISQTLKLLNENEQVREQLRRRFRLILVDEYQDSNGAQFEFLKLLVGEKTQVCVVGDDDQSIYRFRGAEIENILSFNKDYNNVRTIKLEENYRSTKRILKLASCLIANNKTRHDKTIFTNNSEGDLPNLFALDSDREEARTIANIIRLKHQKETVAVVYRNNAQSNSFETVFAQNNIKYKVIGALRFYEREEIKDALALLTLLVNPRDVISFNRMINKPKRGIGDKAREEIISLGSNMIENTKEAIEKKMLSGKANAGAQEFVNAYETSTALLDSDAPLLDVVMNVINEFGLIRHYEAEEDPQVREGRKENLSVLVSAISENEEGRSGLVNYLERITLDSTTLRDSDYDNQTPINLITMHNTKGLEFDTVFVTGLEQEIIPGRNSEGINLEEERRLLYVAFTRARKNLYLSYAKRRMLWGRFDDTNPTQFFEELPREAINGEIEKKEKIQPSWQAKGTSKYSNTPSWAQNIIPVTPAIKSGGKVQVVKNKPTLFNKGDKVRSKDYGVGVIFEVTEKYGKTVIRVRFDNGKTALFNTSFCDLEKL